MQGRWHGLMFVVLKILILKLDGGINQVTLAMVKGLRSQRHAILTEKGP